MSLRPPVHPQGITRSLLEGIFKTFYIWGFLWKSVEKIQIPLNLTRIRDTLHEYVFTFMSISRLILLRMRNIVAKRRRENQRTHFMFNNFFFENRVLYENVEKYGRTKEATDDTVIRRMRFSCWITRATNTHSEYVIVIGFPRQQWFH